MKYLNDGKGRFGWTGRGVDIAANLRRPPVRERRYVAFVVREAAGSGRGRVVGRLVLLVEFKPPLARPVELLEICIRPPLRHLGFGTRTVEAVTEVAGEALPVRSISSASKGFWQRVGARFTGRAPERHAMLPGPHGGRVVCRRHRKA